MSAEREKLIEVMAEAICEATNMNRVGRPELEAATAALTALEAAGVRLVPVEATVEMQTAGYELMGAGSQFVYRAMLRASPYAPEGT